MNTTKENGGLCRNTLPQARSAYQPTHTNKENKKTPKQNKNGAGANATITTLPPKAVMEDQLPITASNT